MVLLWLTTFTRHSTHVNYARRARFCGLSVTAYCWPAPTTAKPLQIQPAQDQMLAAFEMRCMQSIRF